MNFVEDYRIDLAERLPAAQGGEHQAQAFRRGDQNFGGRRSSFWRSLLEVSPLRVSARMAG